MVRPSDYYPGALAPVIGLIVVFLAFYLFLLRVDTFLRNSAIDNCAQTSRYERKDGSGTVSYPIQQAYNECLKLKDIK